MTWFGREKRSLWLESGAYVCPTCQVLRSMSTRQRQRAFVVLGIRLTPWRDEEAGLFAECETCGTAVPGSLVLHDSTRIAEIESAMRHGDEDADDAQLEATQECPHCGRILGAASRICPRCERRLDGS